MYSGDKGLFFDYLILLIYPINYMGFWRVDLFHFILFYFIEEIEKLNENLERKVVL